MQTHEYRTIPAPRRGVKARGAKSPEDRFARAVEGEMNRMAREGWEFVRSDTLPCEVRQGWFGGRATTFQTLLVFRRPVAAPLAAPAAPPLAAAAPPLPEFLRADRPAPTPPVVPEPRLAPPPPAARPNPAPPPPPPPPPPPHRPPARTSPRTPSPAR